MLSHNNLGHWMTLINLDPQFTFGGKFVFIQLGVFLVAEDKSWIVMEESRITGGVE